MSTRNRGLLATTAVTVAILAAAAPLPAQRLQLSATVSELEAQVQRDSTDPNAHYFLALGYWSEKRYDEAERYLKQALAIDNRYASARLALAYLPFARRPKLWNEMFDDRVPTEMVPVLEQSDREYRHAFLIDPLVDLRILAAVTPPRPDFLDVKDYLGEAWALFFQGFADCQEGRYVDCHGRFEALIRTIGGDRYAQRIPSSVLWYKGLAAAHIGKFDVAAEHFRLLMKRNVDFEKDLERKGELTRVPLRTNEYRYTLATILQAAGKSTDAIVLFQEVLNNDIGAYMAYVRLANIFEAQKDFPRAATERLRAVNANPDDASLLVDLGVTLGKAGDFAAAETRFQQALELNPRDVRPLFWLGIARQQLGKPGPAREAFTRYVALAPSRYDRQIAMARERLTQLPEGQ